jgi:hypothetical protein
MEVGKIIEEVKKIVDVKKKKKRIKIVKDGKI